MILTLILFTIANVVLAFMDAHKIIKGKWINHGINAAIYVAMVAIPFFIFHNYFLIGALLVNRLIVFNISLSLFRGLIWDYITPENPPKAISDRIAKSIFGMNGKKMYITYSIIFVVLTVLTFVIR